MIKIGILGDIGSGKSYVAQNFGYPVFDADHEVARLYKKNKKIFNKLKAKLPKFIHSFPIEKREISNSILANKNNLNLDFSSINGNKFFYDVIYNPSETNFLKIGRELGYKTLNGKLMFIYQALSAFNIWHKQKPSVDENVIKLLEND